MPTMFKKLAFLCFTSFCATTTLSFAQPIYNQAYQENYATDNITDIQKLANNAYILLDPDQENIQQIVKNLQINTNEISAYISIGTAEDWRSDFQQLKPFLVKKSWVQWQGEYFISKITPTLIDIMHTRIDKIASQGFDWVEFDNMDWAFDEKLRKTYNIKTTKTQATKYFQQLCHYVHSKNMKSMAKNQPEYVDDFDGITFESYEDDKNWWNVKAAIKFLNPSKLVIINHYNSPNCDAVYKQYLETYGTQISFICESSKLKKYIHYNY